MTKSCFRDRFNFDALSYATLVVIHRTDGSRLEALVLDYWPFPPDRADWMDCEVAEPGGERRRCDIFVPSPEIERIEILARSEEPNHGSHPEVAVIPPLLAELFPHTA